MSGIFGSIFKNIFPWIKIKGGSINNIDDPTDEHGVGDVGFCDTRYRKATVGVNLIGTPGAAGFGVGICPPQLLPDGMISLPGFDDPTHDNYGNYMFRDGSIM